MGLVHRFGDPLALDREAARGWLGGKGAGLADMTRLGLPTPPGFTISTELFRARRRGDAIDLDAALGPEIAHLEAQIGLRFGDASAPLLVSVRSGAPSSMPGMLDTVIDVGVSSAIARGLAERFSSERLGADVRRRFVESYASVVLGIPRAAFEAVLNRRDPRALELRDLETLLADYERLIRHEAGESIPDDPRAQLAGAIEGALRSWSAPRAQKYRDVHGISENEGVAVTVQVMVYGNAGPDSGAGVAFSRNPSTGERVIFGEWQREAQGEDVVSGHFTPSPLTSAQVRRGQPDESLERAMPERFEELRALSISLEAHYGDAQEIEFTIERGKLWVLQTRGLKRTARAAARIAVEMVGEGALDRSRALGRVEPSSLRQLLTPRVPDPQRLADQGIVPLARGLAASPGAATGKIVLDGDAAARMGRGPELVLVRSETSAEDVDTMRIVGGVLTSAGGLTSHAAVVARAMGKPCVAGATSLAVDYVRRVVVARGAQGSSTELPEGSIITIDGTRGLVYAAAVPVEPAPASEHVETLLAWADDARRIRVLAIASSARLARVGMSFGADGVVALAPLEDPIAAIREAAGEKGTLWVEVSSEEDARAAAAVVRPGDVIFAGRAIPGARTIVTERSPLPIPETLVLEPGQAIAVPPLDVPAARLAVASPAS